MVTQGSFETPHMAPQVAQPPVVRKGSKEQTELGADEMPVASPMLLSGSQFLDDRKFLDEGTVRKISSKLFSEPATALKIAQAHVWKTRKTGRRRRWSGQWRRPELGWEIPPGSGGVYLAPADSWGGIPILVHV
jgi:hypothetical protein